MNENDRKAVFSHLTDEWETPYWLYHKLDSEYHFNLDPCATKENAKCALYFTNEVDGLTMSWRGKNVFINPPYTKVEDWATKAHDEAWWDLSSSKCATERTITVLLVPSRTDTRWFHKVVKHASRLIFIKGRVKFISPTNKYKPTPAPFPSMILVFDPVTWSGPPRIETFSNENQGENLEKWFK